MIVIRIVRGLFRLRDIRSGSDGRCAPSRAISGPRPPPSGVKEGRRVGDDGVLLESVQSAGSNPCPVSFGALASSYRARHTFWPFRTAHTFKLDGDTPYPRPFCQTERQETPKHRRRRIRVDPNGATAEVEPGRGAAEEHDRLGQPDLQRLVRLDHGAWILRWRWLCARLGGRVPAHLHQWARDEKGR